MKTRRHVLRQLRNREVSYQGTTTGLSEQAPEGHLPAFAMLCWPHTVQATLKSILTPADSADAADSCLVCLTTCVCKSEPGLTVQPTARLMAQPTLHTSVCCLTGSPGTGAPGFRQETGPSSRQNQVAACQPGVIQCSTASCLDPDGLHSELERSLAGPAQNASAPAGTQALLQLLAGARRTRPENLGCFAPPKFDFAVPAGHYVSCWSEFGLVPTLQMHTDPPGHNHMHASLTLALILLAPHTSEVRAVRVNREHNSRHVLIQ